MQVPSLFSHLPGPQVPVGFGLAELAEGPMPQHRLHQLTLTDPLEPLVGHDLEHEKALQLTVCDASAWPVNTMAAQTAKLMASNFKVLMNCSFRFRQKYPQPENAMIG